MTAYLRITARLPLAAGLELRARLLAARPAWDVEVTEDGLDFTLPLTDGGMDSELTVLEEACRTVERTRPGLLVELSATRVAERPRTEPPAAFGSWEIALLAEGQVPPPPAEGRVTLPPFLRASHRLWFGAELLATLIRDHLTPPPGAPDTRGRPALVLEAVLPAVGLAAVLAGSGAVTLAAEESTCASAQALFGANGRLTDLEPVNTSFSTLARQRDDWSGRFGLIAGHLSPYLISRRLKTLALWLDPEGAVVLAGFAPGPQTAHLLRAAARVGLGLASSIIEDGWAAMKLVLLPQREVLPPLTGSVVPDLVELPEEPFALEPEGTDEPAEDEDSLLVEEEEEGEE